MGCPGHNVPPTLTCSCNPLASSNSQVRYINPDPYQWPWTPRCLLVLPRHSCLLPGSASGLLLSGRKMCRFCKCGGGDEIPAVHHGTIVVVESCGRVSLLNVFLSIHTPSPSSPSTERMDTVVEMSLVVEYLY